MSEVPSNEERKGFLICLIIGAFCELADQTGLVGESKDSFIKENLKELPKNEDDLERFAFGLLKKIRR